METHYHQISPVDSIKNALPVSVATLHPDDFFTPFLINLHAERNRLRTDSVCGGQRRSRWVLTHLLTYRFGALLSIPTQQSQAPMGGGVFSCRCGLGDQKLRVSAGLGTASCLWRSRCGREEAGPAVYFSGH